MFKKILYFLALSGLSCSLVAQQQPATEQELLAKIQQAWKNERGALDELYMQLGDFYQQQGKPEQAVRSWLSVLDISHLTWHNHQKLAEHLHQKEHPKEALALLEDATENFDLAANECFQGAELALQWQSDPVAEKFLALILAQHWPQEETIVPRATTMLAEIYQRKQQQTSDPATKEELKRQIARLKQGIRPIDVKIVITWDTKTDIDLWVTNPQLQRCSYQQKITRSGEKLHNDDTDGYGPETFTILKAKEGRYKVQANYYSGQGKTEVQSVITYNEGTDQQRQQQFTVYLKNKGDIADITDIYIPHDLKPTADPPTAKKK